MSIYRCKKVIKTISPIITNQSQIILPANESRLGFIIYNNSANSIYLTYGPTSNGSTPTRILPTFTQFEMIGPLVYTGEISGIRNAGTGTCIITEFVYGF